jgi:hypothetical protein
LQDFALLYQILRALNLRRVRALAHLPETFEANL